MHRIVLCLVALTIASSLQAAAPKGKEPITVPKITLNHAAMDKLGWKLSCQAYTFGRTGQFTLFETIDLLNSLGVRYIEMYPGQKLSPDHPNVKADINMTDEQIGQLKAKLKSANVTAINFGVVGGLDNDEASARKVFEFAKKMGIQAIVSEPKKNYEMIDKLANEYAINVAFHNHPKPSFFWDPQTVLEKCEGRSNRLGSCSDTGHWYRSGFVSLDCLKKIQGHIISLHFKDLGEDKKDRPWGTGVCNARAMLEEIKRQGIKPVFSIEYEVTTGQELVNNVAKCCEFFSNTAAELAEK